MPEASEPEAEEAAPEPAPHLVPLAEGWMLWRTICLSGAGFPVHRLESLATNDAAAAIDHFIDCEAAWDEVRERAVAWCRDATKTLGNPRQRWLADAQGNRYVSELRVCALNPESWRPSGAEPSGAG